MVSLSNPATNIYIYSNKGSSSDQFAPVESFCTDQVVKRLKEHDVESRRIIALPDSSYLTRELNSYLMSPVSGNRATLIIPGGNTLFLADSLENCIAKIQFAIKNGWNYLGFCSGANIACTRMGNGKVDIGDAYNLLGLLPVHAKVPVYTITKSIMQGGDNERMAGVLSATGAKFSCFWNEGSKLEIITKCDALKPLAFYDDFADKPIAALYGKYGEGHVVATCVHPEMLDLPIVQGKKEKAEKKDTDEKKSSGEDDSAKNRKDYLKSLFDLTGITKAS